MDYTGTSTVYTHSVYETRGALFCGRIFMQAGSTMNATTENMSKFVQTCYILNTKLTVVIKFPYASDRILYIFALIANVIILFTTTFLNGITVTAMWKSRSLKEKVSNFTIMIQSFVDLANGVFFMTLFSVLLAGDIMGSPSCIALYVTRIIGFLLFFYSMTALAVMSFERYMGVLYPFVHRVEVTKGHARCISMGSRTKDS